jgi:hypothetical protein
MSFPLHRVIVDVHTALSIEQVATVTTTVALLFSLGPNIISSSYSFLWRLLNVFFGSESVIIL